MIRTQSSLVTLDPSLLQQSMPGGSSPLVLLLQSGTARLQVSSWQVTADGGSALSVLMK